MLDTISILNLYPSNFSNGFVSEEFGILPTEELSSNLQQDYKIWDEIAKNLNNIIIENNVTIFDDMEILNTNLLNNDKDLARALIILGSFAHTYQYIKKQNTLPYSILQPWKELSEKVRG